MTEALGRRGIKVAGVDEVYHALERLVDLRNILQRNQLDQRGAQVVLISPQPHANTRELAARFEVPFRFLVDSNSRTARALGIVHEFGVPAGVEGYEPDTVMPTAVITDAEGTILLSHQTDNYRIRPEPTTFLQVLDAAA